MATSSVLTPEEEFLRFAQTANLSSREDLMAMKAIWDNAFMPKADIRALLKRPHVVEDLLTTNPFGTQRELGKPQ